MTTPTIGTGAVLERTVTPELARGGGDHDLFAHVVKKLAITDAYVFGTPLTALCGKVWVPSRDPKPFPICPECKEAIDGLSRDSGEDLPEEMRR